MSTKDQKTLSAVLFFIAGGINIFAAMASGKQGSQLTSWCLAIAFIALGTAMLASRKKTGTSQSDSSNEGT